MSSKPYYLGRGRGAGRGRARGGAPSAGVSATRPGGALTKAPLVSENGTRDSRPDNEPSSVVKEASSSRLQKAEELRERSRMMAEQGVHDDGSDCESSDEEVDKTSVLQATLKSYQSISQGGADGSSMSLSRTEHLLLESCRSGGNVCLICIGTIKHVDAVWNCGNCYCMLHIQCVQKWAREGASLNASLHDTVDPKTVNWACPKCRHDYQQADCPSRYFCFCGQQQDPKHDLWLVPHSCGQTCDRFLQPECGHRCLLLCHPGPCPPCPQMVRSRCHCGRSAPTVRRCVARNWSCGQVCGQRLSCGHHTCQQPCHSGACKPCPKQSVRPCRCGRQSRLRPCAESDWSCETVCGRTLDCSHHTCERECHLGDCGPCPRGGRRECPCGKSSHDLPCTEDIPTCGDTCGKLLPCSQHRCIRRCHRGPCDQCRQMVMKNCRCGRQKKSLPCHQELLCESRCAALRSCRRHPCKRRCCDGNCPPCDKTCGRQLQCRNHKCSASCHPGQCYPCALTEEVSCSCGQTILTVPCGRKRVTRPPKCAELCRKRPDCHHPVRQDHTCHAGACPRCTFVCHLALPNCEHRCPLPCHAHLRQKVEKKTLAPWQVAEHRSLSEEAPPLPCPPCRVPVQRECFGRHEVQTMACSEVRDFSCARPCGRHLPCGNHVCQRECHVVSNWPPDQKAGEGCSSCEEPCVRPRPVGCKHDCRRPCHSDDCPPCPELLKLRCFCKAMPVYIKCFEFCRASEEEKEKLQTCPNQCPKMLPCGHQCQLTCHRGACSDLANCPRKVTRRCACKHLRKDFPCSVVQAGGGEVKCDDNCRRAKAQKEEAEAAEAKKKEEEEALRCKAELEQFERSQRGRKRKRRKVVEEEEEETFWEKHKLKFVAMVIVCILLAFMVWASTSQGFMKS